MAQQFCEIAVVVVIKELICNMQYERLHMLNKKFVYDVNCRCEAPCSEHLEQIQFYYG
jgi:hypothetical protein